MATINDIIHARNDAVDQLQAQITRLANRQATSGNTDLTSDIDQLSDKITDIMQQAVSDIIATADFQTALTTMQTATNDMKNVAANLPNAQKVIDSTDQFVGYGTDVANAISTLPKA